MSSVNNNSGKNLGDTKQQLAAMEEQWAQLQAQWEKDKRDMEAAIAAEAKWVEEEEKEQAEERRWAEAE